MCTRPVEFVLLTEAAENANGLSTCCPSGPNVDGGVADHQALVEQNTELARHPAERIWAWLCSSAGAERRDRGKLSGDPGHVEKLASVAVEPRACHRQGVAPGKRLKHLGDARNEPEASVRSSVDEALRQAVHTPTRTEDIRYAEHEVRRGLKAHDNTPGRSVSVPSRQQPRDRLEAATDRCDEFIVGVSKRSVDIEDDRPDLRRVERV